MQKKKIIHLYKMFKNQFPSLNTISNEVQIVLLSYRTIINLKCDEQCFFYIYIYNICIVTSKLPLYYLVKLYFLLYLINIYVIYLKEMYLYFLLHVFLN